MNKDQARAKRLDDLLAVLNTKEYKWGYKDGYEDALVDVEKKGMEWVKAQKHKRR